METDIKIQIADDVDFYQIYKKSNDENIYIIFLNDESFLKATDQFTLETSRKNSELNNYPNDQDKILFVLVATLSAKKYFPIYDYSKLKEFRNKQIAYSTTLISVLKGGEVEYKDDSFNRYNEIIYECELNIAEKILAYVKNIMTIKYDVKYVFYVEILERYIDYIRMNIKHLWSEDHDKTRTSESFIQLKSKREVESVLADVMDEKVGYNSSRKINFGAYVIRTNTIAEINPDGKLDFYKNELYRLVKKSEENIFSQVWVSVLGYCVYSDDKFIRKLLEIKTISPAQLTFFYYDFYLPISHLRNRIFEIEHSSQKGIVPKFVSVLSTEKLIKIKILLESEKCIGVTDEYDFLFWFGRTDFGEANSIKWTGKKQTLANVMYLICRNEYDRKPVIKVAFGLEKFTTNQKMGTDIDKKTLQIQDKINEIIKE